MKKKADYQKMLLKMIRPLTRHYTDDGFGLYLGALETELQKWKDFPGFYGGWPPIGPGEEMTKAFFQFTRKDWRQERILRLLPTGEIFTIRISGWWKWRLSAMAFYWCRKSCGSR